MKKLIGFICIIAVIVGTLFSFTACGKSAAGLQYTPVTIDGIEGYEVVARFDTLEEQETVTEFTVPAEHEGKPVIALGQNAFYGCSALTNLSIPDTILVVSNGALNGCSKLKYNEYDNCLYLGNSENPYVLLYKTKGDSITKCQIHENTKVVFMSVFYQKKLAEVDIPNGVKRIDNAAFGFCELTSAVIPGSVEYLGVQAFRECKKLKSVSLNANIKGISSGAFESCWALEQISIPDTVTHIYDKAFYDCKGLTSFVIGENVTFIGESAFQGCGSLTSITIGNGITSIGQKAFYECRSLTSIQFQGTKDEWNAISKGSGWDGSTGNYTITCTDGTINK